MIKIKKRSKEEKELEELEEEAEFISLETSVNRFKLEEEASKQSYLMHHASKILTKAKDLTRRAKLNLDKAEFESIENIRKRPEKYGVSKTTDSIVLKAAKTTEEYREAFLIYCNFQKKEDEYSALVQTIKQRGYDIKILTELWMNNYYSNESLNVKKFKPKRLKLEEEE